MELNHYGDVILPVLATEDVVEGRFVLLTSHTWNKDYGSAVDLPGVKLPDTADEAALARYVVSFAKDNRPTPLYRSLPQYSFALRYGMDQATNVPFSATVFLTHPENMVGQTIPSGEGALGFGESTVYTLPSGSYVYSVNVETPGCPLTSADTANDGAGEAGKPKYSTTNVLAEVLRYNSTTGELMIKVL